MNDQLQVPANIKEWPPYWFTEFWRGNTDNNPDQMTAAQRRLKDLGYNVELTKVPA